LALATNTFPRGRSRPDAKALTSAPGFRPAREVPDQSHGCGFTAFTAVITLAAEGNRTRYSALAMHKSAEERKAHEALGFHAGWGTALDQLVAFAKTMKPAAAKLGSLR